MSAPITTGSAPTAVGWMTGHWRDRLRFIVDMMRAMSLETDPQELVRSYGARVRQLMPTDRWMSVSRRDLAAPRYRVTRSSTWPGAVNPWKEKDRLPVLSGGLVAELVYGNEPRLIEDLQVPPGDPAAALLEGQRSLLAVPQFDGGLSLNMVLLMRAERAAFNHEAIPEWVLVTNLFGRATHSLVMADELKRAYDVVDRELHRVATIQRSLLPAAMPAIPGLGLAAHYQTSQWAGGDYYDFFPLADGRWGILIADVSGHGTPAAVLMAVVHGLAHTHPDPQPPGALLRYVNNHLATRYTAQNDAFVTAFYGIFDPIRRALVYASAGHNPPRLKRCEDGSIRSLDAVGDLPLGLYPGQQFGEATLALRPGDQIIFYTDGITEAASAAGTLFGMERLDEALENCHLDAQGLIDSVLSVLETWTGGQPAADDRTMVVAKVR